MLTGRGRAWIRRELEGDDEGTAERHALWWPPTKIAGRYLAPYLAAREEAEFHDAAEPSGQLVEFDLERDLPAAADALPTADGS